MIPSNTFIVPYHPTKKLFNGVKVKNYMAKKTVMFVFNRRRHTATLPDPPEAITKVFAEYSENGLMEPEKLQEFLEKVQKEHGVTRERVEKILDAFPDDDNQLKNRRRVLSFRGFFRFIFSDENSPISPSLGVYQDMSAPLSRYFMYASHNSYLTGSQISSACSDVPIIEALQRGVRVIELDLWSNSNKDDIYVLHGSALGAPVELMKCLRSIKEHAFTSSQYPVMIGLGGYLPTSFQAEVAKMAAQEFGETLFVPEEENSAEGLPSPEELKKKIIIFTKPPTEYMDIIRAPKEEEEYSEEDEIYDEGGYGNLIAIAGREKPGSGTNGKVACLNRRNVDFEKQAPKYADHFIRFTQDNLLRIFPSQRPEAPSDYNPFHGWTHGAQMVAINLQVRVYMGCGWRSGSRSKSPPNVYAKVGIIGAPADMMMKRTKVINRNWTPVWDQEEFVFLLRVPELALLRIEVYQLNRKPHKGDLLAGFGSQLRNSLRCSVRPYG